MSSYWREVSLIVSDLKHSFKSNEELFGCRQQQTDQYKQLCKSPYIHTSFILKDQFYVFSGDDFWVFKSFNTGPPALLSDLESGPNSITKFRSMVRNNDVLFAVNDTVFMFLDFRIWSWGPNGKPIDKKRPLFDLRFKAKTNFFQMRYPSQRERSEFGAVIQINDHMFARIRGDFVSYFR